MSNVTKEAVLLALEEVEDPEFHIDIVTMGLIRDVTFPDSDSVHVLLTLTTPFCPFGPQIQDEIKESVIQLGVQNVSTEITFNPPWKMPDGLRAIIGI